MSLTPKNSKNKNKNPLYWGEPPKLTHEQTIEWLEGFRQLMSEVWHKNPKQIPQVKREYLKNWMGK